MKRENPVEKRYQATKVPWLMSVTTAPLKFVTTSNHTSLDSKKEFSLTKTCTKLLWAITPDSSDNPKPSEHLRCPGLVEKYREGHVNLT